MKRLLPIVIATSLLSACGLQPLYSGGSQGPVSSLLGAVTVDPIEGKKWLVDAQRAQ
jgi:LPS-assembly lipoprotein